MLKQKLKKLNLDCNEYEYRHNQVHRKAIKKIMEIKGNEILLKKKEQ